MPLDAYPPGTPAPAPALPEGWEVSTDPQRLDLALVHRWLSTDTYWAAGRSLEAVRRAAAHSLNFGLYRPGGRQAGYARVVTDTVSFGWLADVYIDRSVRGQGLGSALVGTVRAELARHRLRRLMLSTQDAHGVYERFGFTPLPAPEQFMVLEAPVADPQRPAA